jgi:hypothetical protein
VQLPFWQYEPGGQPFEQAPQLFESFKRSTHCGGHGVWDPAQTHKPFWQMPPGRHLLPQPPQLPGSLAGSMHAGLPVHVFCDNVGVCDVVGHTQRLFLHKPVVQWVPHAPQFSGSLVGSAQTVLQRSAQPSGPASSAVGASIATKVSLAFPSSESNRASVTVVASTRPESAPASLSVVRSWKPHTSAQAEAQSAKARKSAMADLLITDSSRTPVKPAMLRARGLLRCSAGQVETIHGPRPQGQPWRSRGMAAHGRFAW